MDKSNGYQDYIGDGVYVSFDGYQIWLAANDPRNKCVALEPSVFAALVCYSENLREQLRAEAEGN